MENRPQWQIKHTWKSATVGGVQIALVLAIESSGLVNLLNKRMMLLMRLRAPFRARNVADGWVIPKL